MASRLALRAASGGDDFSLCPHSADGRTERRLTANDLPGIRRGLFAGWQAAGFWFDKTSPNQGDIDVYTLAWLTAGNQAGRRRRGGKLSHEEWPSWSPDGQWIAYSSTKDDNQEIYVVRPDGSEKKRLTSDPAIDAHPAWSPDGKKIAFATSRWGDLELAVMNADGSELVRLTKSPGTGRLSRLVARRQTDRLHQQPRRQPGNLHDRRGRPEPAERDPEPRHRQFPLLGQGRPTDLRLQPRMGLIFT